MFGTSETSRVLYAQLQTTNQYISHFLADQEFIPASGTYCDIPVKVFGEGTRYHNTYKILADFLYIPVSYKGINRNREKIFKRAKEYGYSISSFIHSKAVVDPTAKLGIGSWIHPLVNIDPYVEAGEGLTVWGGGTHLGHSSKLGNFCWITSGSVICGGVEIQDRTFIGANSTIHPQVKIGSDCIIGSGSIITKDLPSFSVTMEGRNNISSRKSNKVNL